MECKIVMHVGLLHAKAMHTEYSVGPYCELEGANVTRFLEENMPLNILCYISWQINMTFVWWHMEVQYGIYNNFITTIS